MDRSAFFLKINFVLGLFVFMAHTAFLLLKGEGSNASFEAVPFVIYLTIPLACFIMLTGLVSLIWKNLQSWIIKIHALLLALGGLSLLLWLSQFCFRLLFKPLSGRFTLGLLTSLSYYWAYQLREVLLLPKYPSTKLVQNLPWLVGAWAGIIELGILIKFFYDRFAYY